MYKIGELLNRPYYLFRPSQVWRRLLQYMRKTRDTETAMLPWGLAINIHPGETIGASIKRTGILDLPVTETIYRLLDTDELAVDVGANIGYMTSIMIRKVGMGGKIHAFEPHPEIFRELTRNVASWRKESGVAIHLHEMALSGEVGTGHLSASHGFGQNRGTATLAGEVPTSEKEVSGYDVVLGCLDNFIDEAESIAVLKIDVEGHELEVLKGAERLLTSGRIRDIIFEEHHGYPTPVTQFLEARGFQLFSLRQSLWKVLATPAAEQIPPPLWDPENFLATLDAERALSRLQKKGWASLVAGKG